MTQREILVTSALPYANGQIHLGHMLEHIQSDIWVRAMRMAGHRVHFVCADDAHGTSIMLRAEKDGITPKALIDSVRKRHEADLRDFGVEYDYYSSTDSDTNRELTYAIWQALESAGHVESRPVKQLYDPEKQMFLPDRFIKGECPNCHSEDQYGDACEVCGKTYNPTDLVNPYSVVSGATPVEKESLHFFVRLADFEEMLKAWLNERQDAGGLQSEVVNKLQEWFADGLRSWDVSRDAPYFGFEIPGQPGKFFYVWVDAPIGYLASFKDLCASARKDELKPDDYERFTKVGSDTEMVHFIGKDIIYFHTLFWPAMLHGAGLRTPTAVNVHGFLTVNGAKMSKSRGTFIEARTYLDHIDADYLRYFLATQLNPTLADVDLDLKAFEERVNSHLVGKWVNIASRTAGFIEKLFDGKLASSLSEINRRRYDGARKHLETLWRSEHKQFWYERRDFAQVTRDIMTQAGHINQIIDGYKPWVVAKDPARREELHEVCTLAINFFRLLAIYLKPIIPATVGRAEAFLGERLEYFKQAETPLLRVKISPFQPLMTRIDPKKIQAMIEASKESLAPTTAKTPTAQPAREPESRTPATISIDDFAKLDLRIGKVLVCEFVEGSHKLLRFELDAGELGKRQIFSGIKSAYPEPEKLVGRSVVFIANLAPRKMRFGVSEGMILSAGDDDGLFLLDADDGVKPGMPIK